MDYLYKEEELDDLTGTNLQQRAQEIKQRFDHRRSYFHTLRNNIGDVRQWTILNDCIVTFDKEKFNPWNQKWSNI